jgi:TusA-related sulfurtransferase
MVEAIWITCHAATMLMNTGEMLEMWVDEMQSTEKENKQSLTV